MVGSVSKWYPCDNGEVTGPPHVARSDPVEDNELEEPPLAIEGEVGDCGLGAWCGGDLTWFNLPLLLLAVVLFIAELCRTGGGGGTLRGGAC